MVSKRVLSIKPSGIREIFEMASVGAINLGLGELDFEPPKEAREAYKEALDNDRNRYGPTKGIDPLRELVADKVRRYRSDITPANVVITASGTQGTMATFQTLFEHGDEVLIPEPGFVLYEPDSVLADARPVVYPLLDESGFQPDIEALKALITPRTKGLVVNSPSNPTGSVLNEESFRALKDLAVDHDLWVVSDEVYEDFIYSGKHRSFNEIIERSVVLNSFSKSFAVPGWRIGYLTAPLELVDHIAKMQYHLVACPPTPPQFALAKVFKVQEEFTRGLIPIFDRRRRSMVDRLNAIEGVRCHLPEGAFYAFPSYELDIPSRDLARNLVSSGVICAPGTAFGERGEKHLRFSYAASDEDIVNGLAIVRKVMEAGGLGPGN
ncbi:MAG: aminotransferase class I/II-fold pyridoxal phosphate-dependent enzyme [Methanomassiliicoccus sp.]|nr:aminotransferase class I/II-fold pyridoxal phosphate-dependent enzyme [Methanomassiliicoccus sp.]